MAEIAIINGMEITDVKARAELNNKLESVKVNGEVMPVTDNSVNIPVPSKTSDLQNDSGYTKALHFTDVTVSASSFVDDTTLEDYPLKADIPLENVTEKDYANVVFSISDVQLMNFAPVCTTSNGIVTIYAKESPQENITIPLIEVVKI